MRRGIIIRFTILAIVALVVLAISYSFSGAKNPAAKESIEECCSKKCKVQDSDLMLETFSRQLISVSN